MCTGTHDYIPVMNTARVDLFMRDDTQQIENVFHLLNSTAWDPTSLALAVTHVEGWAIDSYLPAIGQQISLYGTKATDLSAENGAVVERAPATAHTGGQSGGEMFPNNTALVIKWTTALRGRSYRGRTYVPGLRSSLVTHNTANPTFVAALTAAASDLWSGMRGQGWDLAIVSYCHNKAWRTTGVATPVVSWFVDSTVDSQRRRLPGRGK